MLTGEKCSEFQRPPLGLSYYNNFYKKMKPMQGSSPLVSLFIPITRLGDLEMATGTHWSHCKVRLIYDLVPTSLSSNRGAVTSVWFRGVSSDVSPLVSPSLIRTTMTKGQYSPGVRGNTVSTQVTYLLVSYIIGITALTVIWSF